VGRWTVDAGTFSLLAIVVGVVVFGAWATLALAPDVYGGT